MTTPSLEERVEPALTHPVRVADSNEIVTVYGLVSIYFPKEPAQPQRLYEKRVDGLNGTAGSIRYRHPRAVAELMRKGNVYVVGEPHKAIGTAALVDHGPFQELEMVAVDPRYAKHDDQQGQRIGESLVAHVLGEAKSRLANGASHEQLYVVAGANSAPFFERMGFSTTDPVRDIAPDRQTLVRYLR